MCSSNVTRKENSAPKVATLPQGALIVQRADRQKENKLEGTCEQNLSLMLGGNIHRIHGENFEHLLCTLCQMQILRALSLS